jgi:hypothetical protein
MLRIREFVSVPEFTDPQHGKSPPDFVENRSTVQGAASRNDPTPPPPQVRIK